MKPVRTAILLVWTSSITAAAACRTSGDRNRDAGSTFHSDFLDFYQSVCDGKRECYSLDYREPSLLLDAYMGVTECTARRGAALFGSWAVEDAASRSFEWRADVRVGGVFPWLGHTGTNMSCFQEHVQMPVSPEVLVAFDAEGFAWAKLEGDDVFIPLGGKATLRHEFHATATLERADAAAEPRVTISVEEPQAPQSLHGALGRGDSFPWGGDRATVVRVVERQGGVLGAIGWVEIKLSDAQE